MIRNALEKALLGDKSPKELSTSAFNSPCRLHKPYLVNNACKGKNCTRIVCGKCVESPLNGYCVDCAIKDIAKNILGMVVSGCVGVVLFVVVLKVFLSQTSSAALSTRMMMPLFVHLFIDLLWSFFWYHGACKLAVIGDAKRGFAQPDGLKYPLYGTWLTWYWIRRLVYYVGFVPLSYVIGPFVGIPAMIRTIRQAMYIKKTACPTDNN